MQDKLKLQCQLSGIEYKTIPMDVKTRWWSTFLMCEGFMDLQKALLALMHGGFIPKLKDEDWWIFEIGVEILGPFQRAMVSCMY